MMTAPHTLITPDLASGLVLSKNLARELSQKLKTARPLAEKPGGTNYGDPAPVSEELIAAILLFAISLANDGWSN